MMAPTEILATQHAETLAEFFQGYGYNGGNAYRKYASCGKKDVHTT